MFNAHKLKNCDLCTFVEVLPLGTAERIFDLVDAKYKEQRDFAKAIGVSASVVSQWRMGITKSYTRRLPQIAEALDTTTEYLLTGEGPKSRNQIVGAVGAGVIGAAAAITCPPLTALGAIVTGAMGTGKSKKLADNLQSLDMETFHRIPILGRISAGLPLYAEQHIEGYTLTDLNGGAEYFALRVSGDSMNAARIQDGDILIVRRQDEVENGEVAVVMVGDDDATVKRFYATGSTVTLMPQSTNPDHQPQIYDTTKTSIRVIGKVVEVKITL